MSIDVVSLIDSLSWLVTSIIAILVVYRGIEIGRALVSGVYRNRAFWVAALGLVIFIQALPGYVPFVGEVVIVGVPLFEIAFLSLFLAFFAFVDSTILVALEMDFFHRNTLHWRQIRIVGYPLVFGFIITILFSPPLTLPGLLMVILAVGTIVTIPYSAAALIIGARRTWDRTLKRHLTLLGFVFVVYLVSFVEATTSFNNPTPASDLLGDFLVVLAPYLLYRAAMTLSPISRIEKETA